MFIFYFRPDVVVFAFNKYALWSNAIYLFLNFFLDISVYREVTRVSLEWCTTIYAPECMETSLGKLDIFHGSDQKVGLLSVVANQTLLYCLLCIS